MKDEVCDCICHEKKGVQHIVMCCQRCPNCGQRIKREACKQHIESCGAKNEKEK